MIKKLYTKEYEWTQHSLAFNPLWPTYALVFKTTKTHFMFFHDLFKNMRRIDSKNVAMANWAKDKCYQTTCSNEFKREILFSLCVDKDIMLETNRMIGDIGVMYNKIAVYANYLKQLYTEVIQRCGQPIVRENLI